MSIQLPKNRFLGAAEVKNFPKNQYAKIKEIIDAVNNLTDGTITTTDLTLTGDLTVGDDTQMTGDLNVDGATTLSDVSVDSLTVTASLLTSSATTITAFAGGGQASATALSKTYNEVTVCATAGDSVKLPAAVAGTIVTVKNNGATALDIFPATGDSINTLAVNLAVRIMPGSVAEFRAVDATVWETTTDKSLTLNAPTTVSGQLQILAANSAGNTVTTITNASQAAARTYTVPDAGANASFAMTEGTQTINGANTFSAAVTFGTNLNGVKEVNHIIDVNATTTAATAGGNLTIASGIGNTSGNGGLLALQGGAGGATGTGGNLNITSGPGGGTSGNSGAIAILTSNETSTDLSGQITINTGTTASANSGLVSIVTGAVATSGNSGATTIGSGASSTTGNSGLVTVSTGTVGTGDSGNIALTTGGSTVGGTGDILLTTGNTASGLAGDVIITTGTDTSATVEACVQLVNAVVRKPKSASVASGATITGPELVGGLIAATGATGNWQLPTAAQITTAIGATPAGTNFEFVFNAQAMTGTNTATLVVGANMSVASAPAITGGGALTVTQDTQVTGGFRIVYDTATTCKIYRIW